MFVLNKCISIAFMLVVVCGCQEAKKADTLTIDNVKNDIRIHLPIGSSKKDVIAFFDARKISHEWLRKPEIASNGNVVFPDSHIEEGVIPDAFSSGWYDAYLYIDFKFDGGDSNLVSYSVFAIYKGL